MVEELTRAPIEAGPRPARARWARWSRAHVGIVVTAVLAGVLNVVALHRGDASTDVLVAARRVAPGARLEPGDLISASVDAGSPLLESLLPAAGGPVDGWIVPHGLEPGEAVRPSDLRPPDWAGGIRSMSVPVEPEHAVAGALRRGDRVDIVGVADGRAAWVVLAAEVLDVPEEPADQGLGDVATYAVTVAVSDEQALRLALALRQGEVEVVRATGAPPVRAPEATASSGEEATADAA